MNIYLSFSFHFSPQTVGQQFLEVEEERKRSRLRFIRWPQKISAIGKETKHYLDLWRLLLLSVHQHLLFRRSVTYVPALKRRWNRWTKRKKKEKTRPREPLPTITSEIKENKEQFLTDVMVGMCSRRSLCFFLLEDSYWNPTLHNQIDN